MMKFTPVYFSMLALVSGMTASCAKKSLPETPQPETATTLPTKTNNETGLIKTLPSEASGAPAATASDQLNLDLSHGFLVPDSSLHFLDRVKDSATSSSANILKTSPTEQRVQIRGKLFTNRLKENYLPAIEGGEVSLKMKFE